jgi:hypothetical protein
MTIVNVTQTPQWLDDLLHHAARRGKVRLQNGTIVTLIGTWIPLEFRRSHVVPVRHKAKKETCVVENSNGVRFSTPWTNIAKLIEPVDG